MSESPRIRVGVIGLGFMGATHIAAYHAAARDGFNCQLTAVCDRKAHRRRGELSDVGGNIDTAGKSNLAFDPTNVMGYEHPEQLLADPDVDLVSICTRTDSHVELCLSALRAGKHVLVEKPVSLKADQIREIDHLAREMNRICMPAMCIRYWPGWSWVKDRIEDGSLGRVLSATFHRLGPAPAWGAVSDPAITGGALIDLHIHDADFVRWCFGQPRSVTSAGRTGQRGGIDHVTTLYHFDGPVAPQHVVAEAGWDHAPGFPFRMRFVVVFERATAEYELQQAPRLMLYRDGRSEQIEIGSLMGYDMQIRAVLAALSDRRGTTLATLAEAAAVTDMLDAEAQSIRTRQTVSLSQ
jgi:predicted dehydrogenase